MYDRIVSFHWFARRLDVLQQLPTGHQYTMIANSACYDAIAEFDETLVKRLIAKIAVFEDHFTIDFKSGVTIEIKA